MKIERIVLGLFSILFGAMMLSGEWESNFFLLAAFFAVVAGFEMVRNA